MAKMDATRDWSAPTTLTRKELLQAIDGTIILALGSEVPTDSEDGMILRRESTIILASGQMFRIRSTENRGATLYRGGLV